MSIETQKTVSLVLGSGGARGLAHIGVIRWLEENNLQIQSISGCSIGSLIGGLYAAGKLDEFESWVREITKVDMLKLLDLSWGKSGLVKGDKMINTLKDLFGGIMIEDLPLAYTAVAADFVNEKEVWINSGELFDAIRASISLPLIFTPHKYNNIELIDGGVLNPVPIAPTYADNTDFTIAVSLLAKVETQVATNVLSKSTMKTASPMAKKITEFVDVFKDSKEQAMKSNWDVIDIANQAFDSMQSAIETQKTAAYPSDYYINIARNICGIFEFDRASEMIDIGYNEAEKSLSSMLEEQQIFCSG